MSPLRGNAGMLLVTIVLLPLTVGCPQNQPTLKIYAVNVHTALDLTSLFLVNQDTGMSDSVLSDPVPPGEFELIEVPLAPYASSSGSMFLSAGTIGVMVSTGEINETPLAVVLQGSGTSIGISFSRGGASLNKALAEDLIPVQE